MTPNMTNERMQAFIDTIVKQTRELLENRADDILRAWNENIEEAHENEKNFPPLKIGISATVDIEAAKIETAIRFTAVYQSTISSALPDPNQLELPGVAGAVQKFKDSIPAGSSVTIESGGKSVTIDGKSKFGRKGGKK